MLGGNLLSSALLFHQKFLKMGVGEGESLPTKAHQVSVLKPGVTEAVFDRRAGPVKDQTLRKNNVF